MNAEEHLAEADRLLEKAEEKEGQPPFITYVVADPEERAELRDRARTHAAIAQVHAVNSVKWTLEHRVAARS